MRSMTGMGTGSAGRHPRKLTVELRSVNNRFLDFHFRLPGALTSFEPLLRELVAAKVERGRVSVSVDWARGGAGVELEVDEAFVGAWLEAAERIKRRHNLGGEVGIQQVAALPEAFRVREAELDPDEVESLLRRACEQALKKFNLMREAEGSALKRELSAHLAAIDEGVALLTSRADRIGAEAKERLELRLEKLGARDAVDPQRLAAEVALLADKATITEEVERLGSHQAQFREALAAKGPVAKRLGFLLQEMHREVNTCGSKSTQLDITNAVLRMKESLENMREQIQNIE